MIVSDEINREVNDLITKCVSHIGELLRVATVGAVPDESFPRDNEDPLYDRAVVGLAEQPYCSVPGVQRSLAVDSNLAGRLVQRMEAEGVIGPSKGGKHDVLF